MRLCDLDWEPTLEEPLEINVADIGNIRVVWNKVGNTYNINPDVRDYATRNAPSRKRSRILWDLTPLEAQCHLHHLLGEGGDDAV